MEKPSTIPLTPLVANTRTFLGAKDSPLLAPRGVFLVKNCLIVVDTAQNRLFIWKQLPEEEHQAPDLVLGQLSNAATGRNASGKVSTEISMRLPQKRFRSRKMPLIEATTRATSVTPADNNTVEIRLSRYRGVVRKVRYSAVPFGPLPPIAMSLPIGRIKKAQNTMKVGSPRMTRYGVSRFFMLNLLWQFQKNTAAPAKQARQSVLLANLLEISLLKAVLDFSHFLVIDWL